MPYSTTEVTNYIAMAQRAYADYMLKAVRLEDAGDEPDSLYIKSRYLSAATRVLQYTDHDLTVDEVEGIIHCMIEAGNINNYSGAVLTLPAITIAVPYASGSAKLSTLTDGPGGGTNTLVGQELRVPAVNVGGTAWEYKKPGFATTVLYVSPSGVLGQTEKGNLIYHYQTIAVAEAAANTGDTIVVLPGSYTDNGLGKDGVTYYFMPGSVNVVDDSNMFNLNSAMTVTIRGNGLLKTTSTGKVFNVSHASAVLDAEFKEVNATTVIPVGCLAGSTKLKGKIKTTYNNASGHAITKSGTSTLILDDVTIITTHSSSYAVSGTGAQDVLVYSARTNNLNLDSDITYVINNILQDSSIQ